MLIRFIGYGFVHSAHKKVVLVQRCTMKNLKTEEEWDRRKLYSKGRKRNRADWVATGDRLGVKGNSNHQGIYVNVRFSASWYSS